MTRYIFCVGMQLSILVLDTRRCDDSASNFVVKLFIYIHICTYSYSIQKESIQINKHT